MKLKEKVEEILAHYDLDFDLPEDCEYIYDCGDRDPGPDFMDEPVDDYLYDAYKEHITRGHYGFALGTRTPEAWVSALIDIINLFIANDPEFEIQQIKIKFGSVRFYVDAPNVEDLGDIEQLLMTKLYDKRLVY